MTDKQVIYKLKNDVACKENIINHLAEYNIKLENQLKRKEQECERLKYNNDYEVAVLETTIDNLKEELEQETTLKEMYFTYYKAKHEDIKGELFKLKAENKKLKQAIAEIKELVSELTNEEYTDFIENKQRQILQLISEAENEKV